MTEYTMSKAAAEILCADINAQMPKVRITVSRLPRLLTDQTVVLQQIATADPLAVPITLYALISRLLDCVIVVTPI